MTRSSTGNLRQRIGRRHGRALRTSVQGVDRGEVRAGEHARFDRAEARVHHRATDDGAAGRPRDQDRPDAAVAFVAGLAAAADAAIEEVRVAEADAVTELVGDDVRDRADLEALEAF